jgi:hypothetical protein
MKNVRLVQLTFLVPVTSVAKFKKIVEEDLDFLGLPANICLGMDTKTPSAKYLEKVEPEELEALDDWEE